jgi:hypothetical protein
MNSNGSAFRFSKPKRAIRAAINCLWPFCTFKWLSKLKTVHIASEIEIGYLSGLEKNPLVLICVARNARQVPDSGNRQVMALDLDLNVQLGRSEMALLYMI